MWAVIPVLCHSGVKRAYGTPYTVVGQKEGQSTTINLHFLIKLSPSVFARQNAVTPIQTASSSRCPIENGKRNFASTSPNILPIPIYGNKISPAFATYINHHFISVTTAILC
jgi:hypothetical protein